VILLTAKIKLSPTPEQHKALKDTLYRMNQACDWISARAWEEKVFGKFQLQPYVYEQVREDFGLGAQVTIRAIGKVTDAYKVGKKSQRKFKALGAFPYDHHILKLWTSTRIVSIWTLNGREKMPFLAGERQLELLEGKHKETDLAYIAGDFYLFVTCEVDEPDERDVEEYLGVDLGIVNIATDSDGNTYAGGVVNGLRKRHHKMRSRLQSKGTKSARHLLRNRSRKEQRFASDVNHCISKELVVRAKRTGRGIALEELTGIRDRVRVRKAQRRQHSSWSFHDLRMKIEYKAKLFGIPVIAVDPRNTSRTCNECGHCEKANRQSQDRFECKSCGHVSNADYNAARNIAGRAVDAVASAVNWPNVSDAIGALMVAPGTSSSALAGSS